MGSPAPASVEHRATGREVFADNLKVLLIAAVIAIHGVLGYAGTLEVWTYSDVRETTLSPVVEAVLLVAVAPFGMFVMALLFLVAGLLTPPSLERKGAGQFARDRLLRLGVPFLVYVLLVQPAVVYAVEHPLGAASGSYWYEFLGSERTPDTGPLWFVGVLLVFSLAYAGWVRLRRLRPPRPVSSPVTVGHLALLATAVAVASFLVRLVDPYGGESAFTDLNLWEWPACAALFGLGVVAHRHAWLAAVPARVRRRCGVTTLVVATAFTAFTAWGAASGAVAEGSWGGGWDWPALVFAALESALTVFGSVWLLAVAQRRLQGPRRWAGPAARRGAYAAFIVQTPVLIALAVTLRPLPVPAEAKASVVAAGGVVASFGLARLLLDRVPGLRRIL